MMKSISLHRYIVAVCAVVLFFLVGSRHEAQAQQVGVKTNALMWAALTPNIGCEVVFGEHSSVDLSAFGHINPYGFDSELLAFQPEFRYWFSGRPMIREYFGVSAMIASYDMTVNKFVYDGNALSVGLTGGYAFYLGTHWRFELSGGFSLLGFNHRYYFESDDIYIDEERFRSFGYKLFPAKLGVSFTYIIK